MKFEGGPRGGPREGVGLYGPEADYCPLTHHPLINSLSRPGLKTYLFGWLNSFDNAVRSFAADGHSWPYGIKIMGINIVMSFA